VFQNLLSNGLKYHADEDPVIRIEAKPEGPQWLFSVSDNGIGIDPQHQDRIFKMFQRLHNRADYQGTGIGLALVKRIIELHGGRIWVESTPGGGSTFFFTVPGIV
ncbi:MAG TPA: ATP-binding protein, partial [Candidatus Acidoferrales bacterium]|nr:ATP-binding protein [Candidatus Acidoferrales bacterium]